MALVFVHLQMLKKALREFEQNHPNYKLVISDVRMSPMSGIEFIKKLREIDANIKVILMTAFEMEGSQLKRDRYRRILQQTYQYE